MKIEFYQLVIMSIMPAIALFAWLFTAFFEYVEKHWND